MEPPQAVAARWHEQLFAGDLPSTWYLMTANFRRVVLYYLMDYDNLHGQDPEAIVEDLISTDPSSENLRGVLDLAGAVLRRQCKFEPAHVVPGRTVHFEAPAFEVVRLLVTEDLERDESGSLYLAPGEVARTTKIILESESQGEWRVAGVDAVLIPGKQPTLYWEPPAHI